MKYTSPTILGLLFAAGISQASTISVTGASNSTTRGTADNGSVLTTTLIPDDTPPDAGQALAVTVSDLDIDGTGGANDSVVLTFTVTTDGQNIQTSGTAAAGWLSSGANLLNTNGEYVQVDFASMTVDLNGVAGSGTGISGESFLGFTGATVGGFNASDVGTINGFSVSAPAGDTSFIDLTGGGNDSNVKAWFDTAAITGGPLDAAGTWRLGSYDFQFEVDTVPEPGSLILLGLSGLALLRRRR